jgi:hypothetical protein
LNLVTIEDSVHSSSDRAVLTRDRPMWILPHGVAWPVFANESQRDAKTSLENLRGGTYLIGFHRLRSDSKLPTDGAVLSLTDLKMLQSTMKAVMTDVYDWDGYILWKRAFSGMHIP